MQLTPYQGTLFDGIDILLYPNEEARSCRVAKAFPRSSMRAGVCGNVLSYGHGWPVHAALCPTPPRERGLREQRASVT